jgi:hypothetical protein
VSAIDIAMIMEAIEDLEPTVRISPELACANPACVVCAPVVEAVADATQTNGARGGRPRKAVAS